MNMVLEYVRSLNILWAKHNLNLFKIDTDASYAKWYAENLKIYRMVVNLYVTSYYEALYSTMHRT